MLGTSFNHRSVLRTLAFGIGMSLALLPAGGVLAAGAVVTMGSDSLDGQFDDGMICGWLGTFTQRGESHWTVVTADDHHRHVTYQEEVAYTVTIHDDPEVPAHLRGVTWRGHNVISFDANSDPSSSREISRSVQVFFEGPFRSLSERITLHVAPDGTVLVDRDIVSVDIDCSTLG